MKYGKIYTYENRNEAEIGKKYIFGNNYRDICSETIPESFVCSKLIAVKDSSYPFEDECRTPYQFMRGVIEEEIPLMKNRQLAEWLAKGNGQYKYDTALLIDGFAYELTNEHATVRRNIRIRSWGSNEWVEPTVDIYERDCR